MAADVLTKAAFPIASTALLDDSDYENETGRYDSDDPLEQLPFEEFMASFEEPRLPNPHDIYGPPPPWWAARAPK